MAQTIPDRSLVNEIAGCFLEACYITTNPANPKATPNGDHISNGLMNHRAK